VCRKAEEVSSKNKGQKAKTTFSSHETFGLSSGWWQWGIKGTKGKKEWSLKGFQANFGGEV